MGDEESEGKGADVGPEDREARSRRNPRREDSRTKNNDREPHHDLNNPVGEPDPTEWPDPYEKRDDPLDPPDPDGKPFGEEPHPATGSRSSSQPHPSQDPENLHQHPPERDKLDD